MPNNEWGDFQTPPQLAQAVVSCLSFRRWSRVLEPTCGSGHFLEASRSLGTHVERLGIEVQPRYVAEARANGFEVIDKNIFDLNLGQDLKWNSSGALLVVGNPPWVTSAQLSSLGSVNLPTKLNIRNL